MEGLKVIFSKAAPNTGKYNSRFELTDYIFDKMTPFFEIEMLQGEVNKMESGMNEIYMNLSKEKVDMLIEAFNILAFPDYNKNNRL